MEVTEKRSLKSYSKWAIAALVFAVLWLLVGLYFAFVVLFIILAVFIDLDSRIPYTVALALLLISALFEVLSYGSAAKLMAAVAFYGIAMGIILQFCVYVKGVENQEEEHPE